VFLEAVEDPKDRAPLQIRWQKDATPFLPGNVLIARPVLGHVLTGNTTYRAVATARLLDAACRPLKVGAEAVFTTQEIIAPMERMREVVHELPAPRFVGLRQKGAHPDVFVYEGTVELPIFQVGDPPYTSEGGVIEWDGDGRPVLQNMQAVRVALAVPRTDAPRGGWPLVIYSHGTGGDYLTFVRNGPAAQMAQRGLASLGFDQVVHGDRVPPGSIDPQLAFVNLANILAARDNMRQGAADGFQLTRLATQEGGIIVKLDLTFTNNRTFTDPRRVMFLGHSQGAITGAPFVALEPDLRGAVFSGAAGVLAVTLYERKVPVDFHQLAKQFLGLNSIDADVEIDIFHPVSSLIQTFIEPADSVNYAPYFLLRNTETKPWATNTFVIQGLLDEQVVPNSGAAFIAATGVDLAKPAPMPIEAMELRGQPPAALPFENNILGVTAGAVQYEDEDHFALFQNEGAKQKAYRFLQSAAEDKALIAR
jgi:predicted esterase